MVGPKRMPACRMCKQNYPKSQFISGNGPRYLVCVRCGIEHGLANPEDVPQYYSDVLIGWLLFLALGRGIELWSGIFFVVLALGTLIVPVIHFLRSTRFNAELSRLTP